jgi:hypothetical protein
MIPLALAILAAFPTSPIKLTAEMVGDGPLPFQAIRLRVTVENVGPEPLTLPPPEQRVVIVGRKREADEQFDPRGVPRLLHHTKPRPHARRYPPNINDQVVLQPGERRTFTFPVAVEMPFLDPLFPEPGTYRLCLSYAAAPDLPGDAPPGIRSEKGYAFAQVTVVVGKPGARDKPWVEALTRDSPLARALLYPLAVCTEEEAKAVADLLDKVPDSTYADYARFALVRHLREFPENALSLPKNDPRVRWGTSFDIAVQLSERKGAERFPFMPHLRLRLPAPERERVEVLMNRDFRDSVEWVNHAGPKMTPQEWKEFRKPPAAKK